MSDLGKIRAGAPRVLRDRLFGRRGQAWATHPARAVDGLPRFIFHPDDIDETQRIIAEASVADLERALTVPAHRRWTIFGVRIVAPEEES